jgi:glutamate formiminotransferase
VLECVPNVSEGRDPASLAALAAALEGVPGVRLLDVSSDSDHHRSVFTLAGDEAPLRAALLALTREAIGRIDLRRHRGAHPRMGAVDVVPFVPLGTATIEEAVAAARRFGKEAAVAFDLPVFLYEEAASEPGRRNLANVRRGGFERLRERLADPAGAPDFGPRAPHPSAGATAVGARFFLVAVNVEADHVDLDTVRAVARTVRESSGGLPAVKALGLQMIGRGTHQVSMNLVDFRRTALSTLLERVHLELRARGGRILGTEIVGLVPRAAVDERLQEILGWAEGASRPVLEDRLGW